jgi:hypothetical protein
MHDVVVLVDLDEVDGVAKTRRLEQVSRAKDEPPASPTTVCLPTKPRQQDALHARLVSWTG